MTSPSEKGLLYALFLRIGETPPEAELWEANLRELGRAARKQPRRVAYLTLRALLMPEEKPR